MENQATKDILIKSYNRISELESELKAKQGFEPIAVIGGALRFSGVKSSSELYDLILNGKNEVARFPLNRWPVNHWFSDSKESGKAYSFAASYLDGIELFDNVFFNIPPDECSYTDPQQRLLLEITVEALQSAGIKLSSVGGSRTGVFIGTVNSGYDELIAPTPTEYSPTGSIVASASGKISYKLNLKGPAISLDTACSSSLASIHYGCKSIHSGECDLVIAGGVNLILTPRGHIGFSQLGAISTENKTKVFDKHADGFNRGEGCGIVILKKLKDAIRDNNKILGVVVGSAINHDGLSNGYTAPSQLSQEEVILEALRNSGIEPGNIGYVEAHGTGTLLGDSIELQALNKVFGKNESDVYIGSIKANIGHTEYSSGMASMFKTIEVLNNQLIPPQINIQQLNTHFNWDSSSLKVNTFGQIDLPNLEYAGISGFGISGTNIHLVLKRYQKPSLPDKVNKHLSALYISARTGYSLKLMLLKHLETIRPITENELNAYLLSNSVHRDHFEYREVICGNDKTSLIQNLELKIFELGIQVPQNVLTNKIKTVFILPGQGSQWLGMASTLYKSQPVFRDTILLIAHFLWKYSKIPLLIWIENGSLKYMESEANIQPVLFSVQVALAHLWISQGINPDAILGISMGEVAGLYIAGALTLDDAAKIICRRSELLLKGIPGYGMCIAEYPGELIGKLLLKYDQVEIAGYYSDNNYLLAGPEDELGKIIAEAESHGVFVKKVRVGVASHCRAVYNILPELLNEFENISYGNIQIPVFSSVYNRFLESGELTGQYWLDNLKNPILFHQSILNLENDGFNCFVELSPHPLTGNFLKQIFGSRPYIYQPTLFKDHDCNTVFSQSLCALYKSGKSPVFKEYPCIHPLLPVYQWDKHIFPIPYENYQLSFGKSDVTSEIKVMTPSWEEIENLTFIPAERYIIYCSFSINEDLCQYNEYYQWNSDKELFCSSIINHNNPLIVFDVSGIKEFNQFPEAIQALKTVFEKLSEKSSDIVFLTSNSYCVTGLEITPNPSGYSWLGLMRSINAEIGHIVFNYIDVDVKISKEYLLCEIEDSRSGNATIFRNNKRYKIKIEQQVCIHNQPIKSDTVLILGGTSDMGLMLADWYAERGTKTIMLHGKRAVPAEEFWDLHPFTIKDESQARIINSVKNLRSKGINVILSHGDICDKNIVASIKDKINENNIILNDVVFMAGTSIPVFFAEYNSEDFLFHCQTRILGWQNLVTDKDFIFDRFIFFSSASGFFHSPGQSTYLFPNNWIDAFTSFNGKQNRKFIAILWPIWSEIGRAFKEGFLPDTLLEPVSNKDLKDYFTSIIDSINLPPVIIAARPAINGLTNLWKEVPFIPGKALQNWINIQLTEDSVLTERIKEQSFDEDELSNLLIMIWADLLGKKDIRPGDHFFQAGGNSILLIKLLNRIKTKYPTLELKISDLINSLTFHSQHKFIKGLIDTKLNENKTITLRKAAISDKYPSSEEQKQIWIQGQLDEDMSLYNLVGLYSYTGKLNIDAFIKSINHIGAEQEIFRTRYILDEGELMQYVDEDVTMQLDICEVQTESELNTLGQKLYNEELSYNYDLTVSHPFRIKLINCNNNIGILILNLHHIAADGWALGYYTTRLSEIYKSFSESESPPILVPEISYKDYSTFQKNFLNSPQADSDAQFWSDQLKAGSATNYLRLVKNRPLIYNYKGKKTTYLIEEYSTIEIRSYLESSGISMYAFLQSLISAYLSILSGEKRIITGTPMSTRIDERLENVVGNFVNLLPLVLEINPDNSFNTVAKDAQQKIADVLAHQLYPFNKIVQNLKTGRDPSRHPVFDILFVLQNHTEADLKLNGLNITRMLIDPEHSKLDLFIEARELQSNIELNFEYNDYLLSDNSIADFWIGIQEFLRYLIKNTDRPINGFSEFHHFKSKT